MVLCCALRARELRYKSRDAFVQPAFFLAGNRIRNGVAVVAFKNMFTSTTLLHKDFVTVVLSF